MNEPVYKQEEQVVIDEEQVAQGAVHGVQTLETDIYPVGQDVTQEFSDSA